MLGFSKWGGDKAPLPSTAEAAMGLMPDSHNAKCESWASCSLALDRIPDEIGRSRHIILAETELGQIWENFGAV